MLYLWKVIAALVATAIFAGVQFLGGTAIAGFLIAGGVMIFISMGKIVLTQIGAALAASAVNNVEIVVSVPAFGSNLTLLASIIIAGVVYPLGVMMANTTVGLLLMTGFVSSVMLAGSIMTVGSMTNTAVSFKHNLASALVQAAMTCLGLGIIYSLSR